METQVQSIADLPDEDEENHDMDEDIARSEGKLTLDTMSKRWLVTAWVCHLGEDWSPQSLLTEPHEYICWGLEKGPKSGKEHFHVYLRFAKRTRMSHVIKMFHTNKLKCMLCKGTESQVRDYCQSTGRFSPMQHLRLGLGESGTFKADEGKAGKRTDLETIAEDILAGKSLRNVALEHPADWIRYNKGLESFASMVAPEPPKQREVKVLWLHGPTGTGKTTRVLTTAQELLGEVYTVTMPDKNPWDGYNGQKTLLLDEWRSTDYPVQMMNRILDKWKYQLPCRYRNKYAEWSVVIICSNDSPAQAYIDEPNPLIRAAFFRRVATSCRYVDKREDQGGPSLIEIEKEEPNPVFPQ